jgi:hypothetical protein
MQPISEELYTWYLIRLVSDEEEEGDCMAMKIERNWNEK